MVREKIKNGQKGIRGLKARMGRECFNSRVGGGCRLNSIGVQARGVREGSHSVTSRDAAPAVRATKSSKFCEGE